MLRCLTPVFGRSRARTLPLVCHRWCGIMADASLWPVVNVAARARGRTHACAHDVARWLQRYAPGMRKLTLQASCCALQPATDCKQAEAARVAQTSRHTEMELKCLGAVPAASGPQH